MLRLKTSFFISLVILVVILFWWHESKKAVDSKNKAEQIFTVRNGESLRGVAKQLKEAGLIRDQIIFFLEVKRKGLDRNIQAGEFKLSQGMNLDRIIEVLKHGTQDEWITIPEGWRNEEIAELLNQKLGVSITEFLDHATEGYMFPDTYRISKDASCTAIVKQMKNNFNRRWDSLNFHFGQGKDLVKNLTQDQIVIIASITEREAHHKEDFPIIAGILLKRFHAQMPLEADATVQYALGYNLQQKTWWKKNLTQTELGINSPYNTRQNAGFPPHPIANPGLIALSSVLEYKDTPYWFYLSDNSGITHYAQTLEGHNININKYLE
jgi:UPF0755 protein